MKRRADSSKVSIVVSVYNEQGSLPELHRRITDTMGKLDNLDFELIYVNDGSTDDSFSIIRSFVETDARTRLVHLARNFGHEIAMTAGLDHAGGDCVVFMDADLQHPPDLLQQMIREWISGKDIVLTRRTDNPDAGWFSTLKSKIFYKLLNTLSDFPVPSQFPDFRLIDRKYADVVRKMKENNRMFRGLISWLGVKNQVIIDFMAQPRFAGKSKYGTKKLISLALNSIISFSIKPLRIASYIGIIAALLSIVLGIIFTIDFLTSETYQFTGYGTTIIMIIFIGSVQLIVLGIIGEYLGRIHIEVKNRPLYVAELFLNDSVAGNQQNTMH
ncbi:MAG: glycosyltransferase [Bacteroidales bacterium]|nr:glycosyltransferase [Bacteroidales bacterium]